MAGGPVTLNSGEDRSAVPPKPQGYGLISSGFKSDGLTRTLIAANIACIYDPSKTWNAGIGLKYQSADGALQAQAFAYWSGSDDYQMPVAIVPAQYLQNAGEVTAKGIDASTRYAVAGWGISGGVSLTGSTFTGYSARTPRPATKATACPMRPR